MLTIDPWKTKNGGQLKDLLKRFADQGAEPGGMPVADFQKMVRDETQRWGQLIQAAGVQPE